MPCLTVSQPRRNVRWPLLSVVLATCLCILYGIKVVAWGLPSWQNGDDYRLSFQLCSFALSLILSFRVKVVRMACTPSAHLACWCGTAGRRLPLICAELACGCKLGMGQMHANRALFFVLWP